MFLFIYNIIITTLAFTYMILLSNLKCHFKDQ